MTSRPIFAVALVFLLASAAPAGDDTPRPGWSAEMSAVAADPGASGPSLRLANASYRVDVLGSLAVGELMQVFVNDGAETVSARYIGRPAGITVRGVEVEVAGETEELMTAAAAPRKSRTATSSRAARRRGAQAERTLQNKTFDVQAGESAIVRTTFRMALPIQDGRFLLQLPAVTGQGVPGADEVAPPRPSGTISVAIHHEEPLPFAESRSHDVMSVYQGDRTVIEPAAGELPSREFLLEFAVGAEDDATLLGNVTSSENDVHEVIAVLTPPMTPPDETVRPKQVLFVLDISGSMANGKLDQARAALGTCLEQLNPADQFNIVGFNNEFRMLGETPVAAANSQGAVGWLARLKHGGGTVLLPALDATFSQPESQDHHRMIVLLTDGALQDRDEVLELLQTDLGEGRMFVIGIGQDVVRPTIEHMAEIGRGVAAYADDADALEAVMTAMFDSVSEPLAWDLTLDWGGAEVESMEPSRLPDLYAGRPVTVRARLRGELPGELKVEASTTSGLRQFTTTLAPAGDERLSGLGR